MKTDPLLEPTEQPCLTVTIFTYFKEFELQPRFS